MAFYQVTDELTIGYHSWPRLTGANVTHYGATKDEGGHANAVHSDTTFDFWLPDGVAGKAHYVDGTAYAGLGTDFGVAASNLPGRDEDDRIAYIGCASHNLGSESYSVQIQEYQPEAGDAANTHWRNTGGRIDVESNDTFGKLFSFGNIPAGSGINPDTAYRVVLSGPTASTDPRIGILQFGDIFRFNRKILHGQPIMRWSYDDDIHPMLSASGEYLGRSVYRRGRESTFNIDKVAGEFIRQTLTKQFIEHSRTKPFFIWPRPLEYPDEVEWAWLTKPLRIRNTGPGDLCSMQMSLRSWEP